MEDIKNGFSPETSKETDNDDLLNKLETVDKSCRFEILNEAEKGLVLRIKGKNTEWIELNKLLPDGFKFQFNNSEDFDSSTGCDYKNKTIYLSETELDRLGWKYILCILHEVKHAMKSEDDTTRRINEIEEQDFETNSVLFKEYHNLRSVEERECWAYAIKNFRSLMKQLDIKEDLISISNDKIKYMVNMLLSTYKTGATLMASFFSDAEKNDLIKDISQLYTNDKDKK